MAEEKKVKLILKVSVSEADGYGKAGKPGDEIEVPADVAERLVAAGIAEAPGTKTEEKPADRAPAERDEKPAEENSGGGYTGRRRST